MILNRIKWFFTGKPPAWYHYVSAFRDNLNIWAVWILGDSSVEVGDLYPSGGDRLAPLTEGA